MLQIYRRHLPECPHRAKGRRWTKCDCPIHCDGTVNGERFRQSMDTFNWERARRRCEEIEADTRKERIRKPVDEAVAAFLASRERDIERSTFRRYRRILTPFMEYARRMSVDVMDDWSVDLIDRYRQSRDVQSLTWLKELELIRQLFKFCVDRNWAEDNTAKRVKAPRDPKPNPRQPYTSEEIVRILAAADSFGQEPYERLRAKAMLVIMRRYALRISDVATLRRDRVSAGRILLYTQKNGKPVWVPLREDVRAALAALPLPAGADLGCPYFFWNGSGDREGQVNTVGRILQAVFRKSEVPGACAHRFRHTLAIEILANGGTIEDAANILGDSPAVIAKHYAPWNQRLQDRISAVLDTVHGAEFGTQPAHSNFESISPLFSRDKMVPGVGLEPTRPFRVNGF